LQCYACVGVSATSCRDNVTKHIYTSIYSMIGQKVSYAHWNFIIDLVSSSTKDALGGLLPPGFFVLEVLYIIFSAVEHHNIFPVLFRVVSLTKVTVSS